MHSYAIAGLLKFDDDAPIMRPSYDLKRERPGKCSRENIMNKNDQVMRLTKSPQWKLAPSVQDKGVATAFLKIFGQQLTETVSVKWLNIIRR